MIGLNLPDVLTRAMYASACLGCTEARSSMSGYIACMNSTKSLKASLFRKRDFSLGIRFRGFCNESSKASVSLIFVPPVSSSLKFSIKALTVFCELAFRIVCRISRSYFSAALLVVQPLHVPLYRFPPSTN